MVDTMNDADQLGTIVPSDINDAIFVSGFGNRPFVTRTKVTVAAHRDEFDPLPNGIEGLQGLNGSGINRTSRHSNPPKNSPTSIRNDLAMEVM